MKRKYSFIDLFAGCGGMSEGFYQENFNSLAHIEIDKNACETLKERMKFYKYENIEKKVLQEDITQENIIEIIDNSIENEEVDLIIGGPPCQSFSTAGRVRDKKGMEKDPRNYLFENYIKILNHYLPKFFVFENVKGILNAKVNGNLIIAQILEKLRENYNIHDNLNKMILNAANFGVPQLRERVIIIGVRKDINLNIDDIYNSLIKTHYLPTDIIIEKEQKKYVSVKEAISDLPFLYQGEGKEESDYTSTYTNDYIKLMRTNNSLKVYNHVARTHNIIDIERYREMTKNKWSFKELMEKREDLVHEKKRLFNNSYVVQWWDLPSKTIIAHLYKDGNQFIHPDYLQARTFTVREAARIQSFPDDFVFKGSRTQQFKQVGNAVPPLLSRIIAKVLKKELEKLERE